MAVPLSNTYLSLQTVRSDDLFRNWWQLQQPGLFCCDGLCDSAEKGEISQCDNNRRLEVGVQTRETAAVNKTFPLVTTWGKIQ